MIPTLQLGGLGRRGTNDPYFNKVVLLILANGANGSTTYTDLSSDAQTVSVGASAPVQDGTGLAAFTGSANCYINGTATKMQLSGGDFTVEVIANFTSLASTQVLYSGFPGSEEFVQDPTGNLFSHATSGATDTSTGNGAATAGSLIHYAAVWQNVAAKMSIYAAGVLKGGPTTSSGASAGQSWTIGARDSTKGLRFAGSIFGVRVTKFARWTATFTPPTTFETS